MGPVLAPRLGCIVWCLLGLSVYMGSEVSNITANEIDRIVGQRIRDRREQLGISQGRLGKHLGLTFSQIQKYEKGSNRIGAGRLWQIASFLGVPASYFFEGIGSEGRTEKIDGARREEARVLSEAFTGIDDSETRASVLALVRSLSGSGGRSVR